MSLLRYCFFLSIFSMWLTCSFSEEKKAPVKQVTVKTDSKKRPTKAPSALKKVVPLSAKKPASPQVQKLLKPSKPVEVIQKEHQAQIAPKPAAPKQLLYAKPAKVQEGKLVILDPGHGGYDLGARMSSVDEKSLALSTALLAKKHLQDMGYRVVLTRSRDVFISLEKRALIANETKGKLFVSIHFNAANNPIAKGVEVFYNMAQDKIRGASSKKLATGVLHKIIDKTASENRGIKEGNFFVIRETKMPSILVEAGFMTHPDELHLLKDVQYRDKIAKGIAEGVDLYFR